MLKRFERKIFSRDQRRSSQCSSSWWANRPGKRVNFGIIFLGTTSFSKVLSELVWTSVIRKSTDGDKSWFYWRFNWCNIWSWLHHLWYQNMYSSSFILPNIFTTYCISDSNYSMLSSLPHWWQNKIGCVEGPLVLKSVLEFDPHTAEAGGDHPVFFFQLYSTNFCGLQSRNKFSIFFGTHTFKNHYMTHLRFFSVVFVKTSYKEWATLKAKIYHFRRKHLLNDL